jgi:hypothetical protein
MIVLAEKSDSFYAEVSKLLNDPVQGLSESLALFANGRKIKPTEGPIRLGTPRHVFDASRIEELAAHYRASVETSRRAYPYFAAAED